jgi:hypothetical protein
MGSEQWANRPAFNPYASAIRRCVVQRQEPAVVVEDEDVGGVGLGSARLAAAHGSRDVFEACYPCDVALDFHANLGWVDAHGCGVLENPLPGGPDRIPSVEPPPSG